MSGKPAKGVRLKWYPTIGITGAAVLVLGVAWLAISQLPPKMPTQSVDLNSLSKSNNSSVVDPKPAMPTTPLPAVSPVPDKPLPESPARVAENSPQVVALAVRTGALRISNPTDYPVRVALLPQKPAEPTSTSRTASPEFDIPAHWDFAPQEGGTKGLLVSLPDRNVTVRKGDILVAFAQDGSRRYWGPYVVGETPIPTWNPKTSEWQLILQP